MGRKGRKKTRKKTSKKSKKKWFNPKGNLAGWKKTQKASTRRRHAIASTPKNLSLRERRLKAARKLQALANVTKDPETKRKAKADAGKPRHTNRTVCSISNGYSRSIQDNSLGF